MSTICTVKNGTTPRRDNSNFWTNGTIPWFTIDDKHDQGLFINKTRQHVTEIAMSKDRIVSKNSVLLCCTASVGEVAFTNIDITTNQQFNGLTVKKEYERVLNPLYLLVFALTLKNKLNNKLATSTTFGFVSVAKVESIIVPIPPYNEQIRIVKKYEEIAKQLNSINNDYFDIQKYVDAAKRKILEDIFGENSSYKSYYKKEYLLDDLLPYEQPGPYIVKSTNYDDKYDTPVLTPGKSFILGYTNEKDGIYRVNGSKAIIFDDFTTASRLIDFDFKVKSSAMKILKSSDESKFNIDYLYFLLQTIYVNNDTHKRYWISEFAIKLVKVHTFDEQIKIVKAINDMKNKLDYIIDSKI